MSDKTTIQAKGRPMLHREGKTARLDLEYYPAQEKEVYGEKQSEDFNKIFWGDNFQVLSYLLKEYRGEINLIYIDPPFDSKADYVKKVKFRGKKLEGQHQSLMEEKQYSDIRGKDEYLQFMFERLLLLRELLSDDGSIYLHCDWHKSHHLRCIMDEVFGEDCFRNEIVRNYGGPSPVKTAFARKHDTIIAYGKGRNALFNTQYGELPKYLYDRAKKDENGRLRVDQNLGKLTKETIEKMKEEGRIFETSKGGLRRKQYLDEMEGSQINDVWDLSIINSQAIEDVAYPTQKPEALLERIIKASSNPGDIVLDCFMGSGTTCAVAQKLGRKWIGCDINTGAIQTTTKRLLGIVEGQKEKKPDTVFGEDGKPTTPLAFKVYNVNEYNLFKNKEEGVEAYKEILLDAYGVQSVRGYWDGKTSSAFVKVIDPNRILSKKDVDDVLEHIDDTSEEFMLSTSPLKYYDIDIICSGCEIDIDTYIKKQNKSGCVVKCRNILLEKEGLVFKEKPTVVCGVSCDKMKLQVKLNDFFSPVLMRRLEIENKNKAEQDQARVEDYKQTIDSVAIDVDYDGELFNAEIIDTPSKKETITGEYTRDYKDQDKGKQIVAIKVIDILGEEIFETYEVEVG